MIRIKRKRFEFVLLLIINNNLSQIVEMIERLEKISAQLFKNALKTYTVREVLTHKRAHAINVPEMLSLYPNRGVGFLVRKKDWTPGVHYEVRRADYKSHRHASFFGIKNVKDYTRTSKVQDTYPHRIQGLSKRGVWTYDLGKFETFKNDNGVVYTRADYEAFLKLRGVGIRKTAAGNEEVVQDGDGITAPEAIQTE